MTRTDADCMDLALAEAGRALRAGEAPVGACLVRGDQVVVAHNEVSAGPDPTAHAEITVIREAARVWRTARLDGSRLFVSVEPCAMCVAACHYAGIDEIVYAASLQDMQSLTGKEVPATAAIPGLQVRAGGGRAASIDMLQTWAVRRQT